MNTLTIGLSDLLRASQIKRWHIVETTRPQTLAEHNYNVATIALALRASLTGADSVGEATNEICILTVTALFHDADEIRTGDIPTPGKVLLKKFGGADLFDKIAQDVMPYVPFIDHNMGHNPDLACYIKMADIIDAYHFIKEYGVGARASEVADKCHRNLCDLVDEWQQCGNKPWRSAVNEVLAALLLPPLRSELS